MKIIPAILLFLAAGIASAQQFTYPTIKTSGSSLHTFVPEGWTVLDSAFGDLNRDGRRDAAFVIESNDTVSERRDFDVFYYDRARARILVILFRDSISGGYHLAEQNNTFIMRSDVRSDYDPFDEMDIKKGVLLLHFSALNAAAASISYQFRFQEQEFCLIGAEAGYVQRGSGEFESRSYNFLTRTIKIITGNISKGRDRVRWRTLPVQELKTFKTFPAPFTWRISKDFDL